MALQLKKSQKSKRCSGGCPTGQTKKSHTQTGSTSIRQSLAQKRSTLMRTILARTMIISLSVHSRSQTKKPSTRLSSLCYVACTLPSTQIISPPGKIGGIQALWSHETTNFLITNCSIWIVASVSIWQPLWKASMSKLTSMLVIGSRQAISSTLRVLIFRETYSRKRGFLPSSRFEQRY